MSSGGNISVASISNVSSGCVVAWGPPNPGVKPGGYFAGQTSLWMTGVISEQWQALNYIGIDTDNAVPLAAPPCAVSRGTDLFLLDIFVTGADGSLWHSWFNVFFVDPAESSYGGWEYFVQPFNGTLPVNITALSVVSWGQNRLDVFAVGTDNNLWHRWYDNNGWANGVGRNAVWVNLGAPPTTEPALASPPSVVSWGPNRIDIFAQGNDGNLWQESWLGTVWSGWQNLDTPSPTIGINSPPSAVAFAPDSLAVFVQGTDDTLWYRLYVPKPQITDTGDVPPPANYSWNNWTQLRGANSFTGVPAAVSGGPNAIDVFAFDGGLVHAYMNWEKVTEENRLYTPFWTPSWGDGFQQVGPAPPGGISYATPPCPVSWSGGNLAVYYVDSTGLVHYIKYMNSQWTDGTMPGVTVQT
jgi:hypothetical protein